MIDIHCHILPWVDDGSPDMDASIAMARMAAESGVTDIIATPHCNLPQADEPNFVSPELLQKVAALQKCIDRAGILVRMHTGAEVFCTPEVPELLRQGKLPTLANSRYLLVEFYFDESGDYIDRMLHEIMRLGYTPVVAHPERYEAVQEMPVLVERWFREGIVIQLNKGSILGRLGYGSQRTAQRILAQGYAHIVASDAHSPDFRTPHMTQVTELLEDTCGTIYTDILLLDNPRCILNNTPLIQAN